VPAARPSTSVPVFWKSTALVIVWPVPVRLTFFTVFGTVRVATFTGPVNEAVPPMFCSASASATMLVAFTFAALPLVSIAAPGLLAPARAHPLMPRSHEVSTTSR